MGQMTLIGGKFYKDGQVVPPEFGNKEQIQLIQEHEQKIEALNGDGWEVEIEMEYVYVSTFKCICGTSLTIREESDDDLDHSCMIGKTCTCHKCKKKYRIHPGNYGEAVVKFE